MLHTRTTWIRTGIGLTALSALLLTGCAADDDAASFSDGDETQDAALSGDTDEPQETETPEPNYEYRVTSGFFYQGVSKDLTTVNTVRPTNKTVTTPAGTLTINQVDELSDIDADAVGLEQKYDEATTEILPYGPAEGEVLRVIDFAFVASDTEGAPSTDLSLKINGTQTHVAELRGSDADRILLSVPADGSAQLVVSSDGHDQFVDLLTGERADDPVTATYYRDVTRQEPHHVLKIDSSEFQTWLDWLEQDIVDTVSYDVQIDSVELTPWQPEKGWAPEGRTWAAIDWTYDINKSSDESWGDLRIESFQFDLAVNSNDEQAAISIAEADTSRSSFDGPGHIDYVSVPVGTTTLTLSVAGQTTMVEREATLKEGVDPTASFSSGELALDFPDGDLPSTEDEPAEDETDEPATDETEAPEDAS
ncbi:hypothetical protein GCM10010922_09700 [Microbacterium sorbitolivorans]|uniref:Uncharacterized protein n=1 Tax=Microbacterium sorbitolivorans TaxID=1867410 RepID=A0A367XXW1_9MICO|nr:hypothetical protein [Microbacterium sorbitolivorans]RCK58443.1 hypothetical protein DTO57_09775 [Microbacterium sorbitolivorans]GGF36546.1 hypothetical protein GCM10010922_09700 [Microbacterium sorbitolivorans]